MKKLFLLMVVMFFPLCGTTDTHPDNLITPVADKNIKTLSATGSEAEKIAYLGVSVVPAIETVTAQLKLPRNTGLVVVYIDPESAAAKVLEKNDVLYKLDNQILVNPEQFAVLIRMFKSGDEISLEIFRGGAPLNVKVKLGERSITPGEMSGAFRISPFPPLYTPQKREEVLDKIRNWLDKMGIEKERISETAESIWKDIMETLRHLDDVPQPFRAGRHRENERKSADSKVISVTPGGASWTDNEHQLLITRTERGLMLSAREKTGKLIFEGIIDNEEQLSRVPAEIQKKVRELKEKFMSQPVAPSGLPREAM